MSDVKPIHDITVSNSSVSHGGTISTGTNPIYTNPPPTTTVYDPNIQLMLTEMRNLVSNILGIQYAVNSLVAEVRDTHSVFVRIAEALESAKELDLDIVRTRMNNRTAMKKAQ